MAAVVPQRLVKHISRRTKKTPLVGSPIMSCAYPSTAINSLIELVAIKLISSGVGISRTEKLAAATKKGQEKNDSRMRKGRGCNINTMRTQLYIRFTSKMRKAKSDYGERDDICREQQIRVFAMRSC